MKTTAALKLSSDLMQNFKALRPAAVEKDMQAVCRDDGKAFLSISDDGRLFVTAEREQSAAGWERTDISAGIRGDCGTDAKVVSFSVNADRDTAVPVLAAALSANGKQSIYLSSSGSMTQPLWIPVTLPEEIQALAFHDISVSSYQGKVIITAYYQKPNGRIERYSLSSANPEHTQWIHAPLPTDFSSITDTKLGRASYSRVDGTYTLGMSGNGCQLLFTPAYNYYDPELAPASSRLLLPCKADAVSTLPSPAAPNATDVFVCGEGSLYWFSSENQDDLAKPVEIAKSPHFYDVKQLFSFVSKGRVYIWLRNESKNLCYLFADCKNIGNPGSWSVVSILKQDMDYVYPFRENETNAMYGYTKNGEGILGYESKETGLWSYVTVFVSQNLEQSVLINSYVTLIKTPQPEQEVSITVEGNRMVDINGGIYSLKGSPVRVKSTAAGDIRITELSESVYAAKFRAWLDEEDAQEWYDPGKETADKLFALGDSGKLSNAVITSQTGETEYLVPKDTPKESIQAAAQALQTLDTVRQDFDAPNERRRNTGNPSGIRLRFQEGKLLQLAVHPKENSPMEVLRDNRSLYRSEDVLGYLRSLCETSPATNGFFDIVIQFFEDAWHFIVQTAEKVVSFVLDCVEAVVSCAVEIFRTIKVTVEKVIAFLKYVFDMDDILLAKEVIKKILNVSQTDMKQELAKLKGIVKEAFASIDQYILEWGGIDDIGKIGNMTLQQVQDNSPEGQHLHDVHANYLTNTLAENSSSVNGMLACPREKRNVLSGEIDAVIDRLAELYEGEKQMAETLIHRLQHEFFDEERIDTMDILTILRKLGAILASAVVEGAEEVVGLLFDLVIYVLDLFYELLNQDIYIPCVSELLALCGIGPFSILDLLCFLPAFMGTVIYKIAVQKPLVSSALHDQILQIHSLSDLRTLTLTANGEPPAFHTELFTAFKALSATATFIECILAAIDFSTKRTSTLLGVSVAGMAAIDGGLYVANSFFVYEPLKGKLPSIPKYILTGVKYLPFLGKAVSLYYTIFAKNKEKADHWDKIFGTLYAITSAISIGGNIYYIVAASKLKEADANEKTAYILDTISLIPDNLRNVADGILRYVTPEKLVPFIAVLAVRSLCGIGYGVLQIVGGNFACKDRNPLPNQPALNEYRL